MMTLVIALAMVLAMSASAFAADAKTSATGQGGNYSISVNPTNENQTYTLYKIFDATTNAARQAASDTTNESDVDTNGINYTLPSGKSLTQTYTYTNSSNNQVTVSGATWFDVDAGGNVTLKSGKSASDLQTEDFRQWAKQFGTSVASDTGNGAALNFTQLKDGYYFITTTTGSLATVTSVAPNALVKDKNQIPSLTKTEDQSTNDFDDTVTYTVNIKLEPGSKNVTFHDELSDGLTLQGAVPSFIGIGETALNTANYAVTKWEAVDTDGVDDITITFAQSYLDTITEETTVKVTYSAKINDKAVVNEKNDAYLKYGESGNTESEHVTVYESTFKFKVNKVDGSNAALSGAKFVLGTSGSLGDLTETLTDTQKASLLKFTTDGKQTQASTATNYILEANNAVTFNGLDGDAAGTTYYLYEVKAPDGYNKLTGPIEVKITPTFNETDTTKVDSYKVSYKMPGESTFTDCSATAIDVDHEFNVQNNQGSVLPSTGGIGTTIFYILGSVLVIGGGILLISRRRLQK